MKLGDIVRVAYVGDETTLFVVAYIPPAHLNNPWGVKPLSNWAWNKATEFGLQESRYASGGFVVDRDRIELDVVCAFRDAAKRKRRPLLGEDRR